MSRWGKPTKNKKRRDPRYFLNENVEHYELKEFFLNEVFTENLEYGSEEFSKLKDMIRKQTETLKTGKTPSGKELSPFGRKTLQKSLDNNLKAVRDARNRARDKYDKKQGKSNTPLKLGGKNSPTVDNINDIMKLPKFAKKPLGAARGYIVKTFFKDEVSDQNALPAVLKSLNNNNDQFIEIVKKLYQSKKALEGSEKMLQDFVDTIKSDIRKQGDKDE